MFFCKPTVILHKWEKGTMHHWSGTWIQTLNSYKTLLGYHHVTFTPTFGWQKICLFPQYQFCLDVIHGNTSPHQKTLLSAVGARIVFPWWLRLAWPSVCLTPVTPALFGWALQGQLILEVSSGLCAQRGEGRSNTSSRGLVTLQEWRCNLSSPMFNHEEKLFIIRAAHLIRACFCSLLLSAN